LGAGDHRFKSYRPDQIKDKDMDKNKKLKNEIAKLKKTVVNIEDIVYDTNQFPEEFNIKIDAEDVDTPEVIAKFYAYTEEEAKTYIKAFEVKSTLSYFINDVRSKAKHTNESISYGDLYDQLKDLFWLLVMYE
jgi:phosphomevalonate kinase